MTGVAKTLDKAEETSRRKIGDQPGGKTLANAGGSPYSAMANMGELKRKYGERHDIDTDEGYYAGKRKHEEEEAKRKAEGEQAQAAAEAKAAQTAAEAAALEKSQESQRTALKRKGRRASILTSSQGAADPLGVPGA